MTTVYVDWGYVTGLGVGFHDRVSEVEGLERLIDVHNVVVVYGPRGVGKSELVRYTLHRSRFPRVIVDAREERARRLVDVGLPGVEKSELMRRLVSLVARVAGLRELVDVLELLTEVFEAVRVGVSGRHLVVVVDEFHLLPQYSHVSDPDARYAAAVEDLEAVAGLLVKNSRYWGVRLVLTVSEGFAVTDQVLARLRGYNVGWMLVEQMDHAHFSSLYHEYRRRHGCRHSLEAIEALAGRTPGVLPELCSMELRDWIKRELENLETALIHAKNMLSKQLGLQLAPKELIRLTCDLLGREVKPLTNPELHHLAQTLTKLNIVYPVYPWVWRAGEKPRATMYQPQYPVYRAILEEAVEKNVETLTDLDVDEIYRRALKTLDTATQHEPS